MNSISGKNNTILPILPNLNIDDLIGGLSLNNDPNDWMLDYGPRQKPKKKPEPVKETYITNRELNADEEDDWQDIATFRKNRKVGQALPVVLEEYIPLWMKKDETGSSSETDSSEDSSYDSSGVLYSSSETDDSNCIVIEHVRDQVNPSPTRVQRLVKRYSGELFTEELRSSWDRSKSKK